MGSKTARWRWIGSCGTDTLVRLTEGTKKPWPVLLAHTVVGHECPTHTGMIHTRRHERSFRPSLHELSFVSWRCYHSTRKNRGGRYGRFWRQQLCLVPGGAWHWGGSGRAVRAAPPR